MRSPHQPTPKFVTGIVVALIAIGVLLRLAFLGTDSLWLDEAFSVSSVAQHSVRQAWETSLDPNHPPLYFVVLWFFVDLGGVSETVARLPSALASVCNLALVFVLARRLGMNARAATTAVLLMAFAPLDIWYAQEARMYAMVTTTVLVFAIGLTLDSWGGALLAAMALAIGLYVDFTMVALSAAVTSLWFVRWWHTGRRLRHLALVVTALTAGWMAFLPQWPHLGEVLRRIDTVPLLVNLRRSFGIHIAPGPPAVVLVMLIALGAATTAAATWTSLQNDRVKRWWEWLVWAAFIAVTIVCAVPRGYSAKQFLATGWPFVVLVVAWTLTDASDLGMHVSPGTSLRRWRVPLAIGVSIVAAIVTVGTPRADWRGAVRYLNQREARTGAVWLDPPWNITPYDFYRPRLVAATNALQSTETAGQRTGDGRDICLVAERFGGRPPTSPTETWLDTHFTLVQVDSLARLEVRCYSRQSNPSNLSNP